MTIRAFCTTCRRTTYIGDVDEQVCPVCASPLTTDPDRPARNGGRSSGPASSGR